MKEKFSYCNLIKVNEPVLKPGKSEKLLTASSAKIFLKALLQRFCLLNTYQKWFTLPFTNEF